MTLHDKLFPSQQQAFERGIEIYPDPTFSLYESEALKTVGIDNAFVPPPPYPRQNRQPFASLAQPVYLPRPFALNSVQATAVRLALVQYYRQRGWLYGMSDEELGKTCSPSLGEHRRQNRHHPYGRGFIIGDGTGVGKTREMAAFILSVIMAERAVQDTGLRYHTCHPGSVHFDSDRRKRYCGGSSLWSRQPLIVWLTCSETLFESCKEDLHAVINNSDPSISSWRKAGVPDAPGTRDVDSGLTAVDHDGRELFIKFTTLNRLRRDMALSNGVVAVPTILFMTYAGLNVNLEKVLELLIGGGRPIMESGQPIVPIVTAILCDEFHKTKSISDAFRKELARGWEMEDTAIILSGNCHNRNPPTAPAPADIVRRFFRAMTPSQTAKRQRRFTAANARSNAGEPSAKKRRLDAAKAMTERSEAGFVSRFLSELGQSDSFRLLVELTKRDVFFIMASATPFQSNQDLHTIDHLVRGLLPAYTSLDAFQSGVKAANGPTDLNDLDEEGATSALVENGEYATRFLEDLVKLLYHQGQLVSRAISMSHVECAVVRCPMSPMQEYAIDEMASYMHEAKRSFTASSRIGVALVDEINSLAANCFRGQEGWTTDQLRQKLDRLANSINRGKVSRGHLSRIAPFFRILIVDDERLWQAGGDVLPDAHRGRATRSNAGKREEGGVVVAAPAAEYIFDGEQYTRTAAQYGINISGIAVSVCKAMLLALKARSVGDAVKRLRKNRQLHKVVIAVEQTGDAYLASLLTRMVDAIGSAAKARPRSVLRLCQFDALPLANSTLTAFRLLCHAVAIKTAIRILPLQKNHTCVLLVPRLPPAGPLLSIGGNFLDTVEQSLGESRHAEITNRKLQCRWTTEGLMVLSSNDKSSNTRRNVDAFNNSSHVDVVILGPKGNTGLSLHDSTTNAVAARRLHMIIDLPYNPVAFRQGIGRTHRNGQASTPMFMLFSTDAPAERRFFESLEARVKDSAAGSFGDRYSRNKLDMARAETVADASSVDETASDCNAADVQHVDCAAAAAIAYRENFIDRGLVLKVTGTLIRIVVADIGPLELFSKLGQMGLYDSDRFVFVEGLDSGNGLFVEILTLGLDVAYLALLDVEENSSSKAAMFTRLCRAQSLVGVVRTAGRVLDSNLVESLMVTTDARPLPPSTSKLLDSATRLYTLAMSLDRTHEMLRELLDGIPGKALRPPGSSRSPGPTVPIASSRVLAPTIRVLGAGSSPVAPTHVIPPEGGKHVIPPDFINEIPLVAAVCVLSKIAVECPSLVLRITTAAMPHERACGPPDSFILIIAKKLSEGKLDNRQFQNSYFSPLSDASLMRDIFTTVRRIMARDDRLEQLCNNRVNPVVHALYVNVAHRPAGTVSRNLLLTPQTLPHVARELLELDGKREEGTASPAIGMDTTVPYYEIQARLVDGTLVTLKPGNSIFVENYLDYFIIDNIVGCRGSVVRLKFENHLSVNMPPMALFERS
nr:MAG: wsv026-like protein [Marsupenaeus japonicus pemonivirus]